MRPNEPNSIPWPNESLFPWLPYSSRINLRRSDHKPPVERVAAWQRRCVKHMLAGRPGRGSGGGIWPAARGPLRLADPTRSAPIYLRGGVWLTAQSAVPAGDGRRPAAGDRWYVKWRARRPLDGCTGQLCSWSQPAAGRRGRLAIPLTARRVRQLTRIFPTREALTTDAVQWVRWLSPNGQPRYARRCSAAVGRGLPWRGAAQTNSPEPGASPRIFEWGGGGWRIADSVATCPKIP